MFTSTATRSFCSAPAGVVIPLVRRFGFNPVLGYLGAGAILGPLGLGSFIDSFPFLYWVTVVDAKNVAGIAELGVVFLLFLIGMELSYERLKAHAPPGVRTWAACRSSSRRSQSASSRLHGNATRRVDHPRRLPRIVVDRHRRRGPFQAGAPRTIAGRASLAVLLAQDLAVVPILLFISIFGAGAGRSVLTSWLLALANAAIALERSSWSAGCCCGRCSASSPPSARTSCSWRHALFVIVGTGVATAVAGLSMALGAFVAGLLLAETEFRKAIETDHRSVQGTPARPVLLRRSA